MLIGTGSGGGGGGGIDTGVMETGGGGGRHNTQKTVAIVIGGLAGLFLGIAFLLVLKSAFKKKKDKYSHSHGGRSVSFFITHSWWIKEILKNPLVRFGTNYVFTN